MTDHSDLIENFARAVSLRCHSHPGEERRSATERANLAKQALVDALSSQSLSLSEAREEIERLKGLVAGIRETDTTYVIWSNEHRAWWGPDRRGYCSRLADAGRYDRESALGVCIGARGGRRYNDNPSEVMVLFEDACLFWPDDKPEWREARARWNAPLEEPLND